ncbi:fibronectin type III domain-containing protein [Chryseobacterium sp. MFBS3-17]|uniref:fibronectin type III domain-containing protein n=1 Tax=Chryseobacterium sp. MFBS3-17 TaxID=2886689 RepID=UPI001D0EAAE2|nr:fibronectin type III domain-containing protein [Chryseobacterium sp. MFBS3-17]MCC2589746.1 fibronectin type III domain-containing protein [Chryseobacterium sp. MFBS3-17]
MKKLLLILILGFISMVNGQTCAPVGVPFIQSFGGGALPNCWVNQNPVSTSTYALWRFSGAPGYGATNNGKPTGTYAWVDASSPYDNLHNVELLSPQINLTGLTDPYVEFEWFKNHLTSATGTLPNYDNNALRVHVNDGTGWVQIFSDTSNHDEWRTVGISLGAAYVGATIQLRFTVDKDVNGNGYFYDDVLLDEIQVKQAPTCFEPTALLVTNITPTSVTVDWTAANPAPAQGYEYYFSTVNTPPTAATVGTPVAAGVTTATFTPVTQGTTYYWWVRSVCSPTDKTAWVPGLPFVPGNFGPSPLPYHQDFTNGYDFTLIGNQTNKWFYGSAAGNPANSIYISNDNGASNTYTNNSTSVAHAYKDLIIPAGATSATFSFDWRAYGESCCDYIRVWLVPATFTPTAGAQITAGSGRIQVGGNMNLQSNWQTYMNTNLNISSFAGSMMRLVFEWRNDGSVGTMPPAAIDNINLLIPTCPTPTNMNVSNVTPNSATLGWTGITPVPANGYEYYLSTTNTPPTAATAGTAVPGPTANLTTLTPGTTYYWWVRAICSPTDSSLWIPGPEFTPGQIGSGTTSMGNLPVYSCFGYGYSQQIYTAAEVTSAVGNNNVISRIRFKVAATAATQANYNQWTVFMGNTNQANFATTTSWVPYNQLMQVYQGTLGNMTAGTWVELTLAVPFIWDGTSNLVIAVDENAPDWSCTANWGSYSAGTNRGMLYYSDSTNPDPVNPPTATSRYSTIPQLQLVADPLPACTTAPPTLLNVTGLTNVSANLSWMPAQGATYILQWRPVTTPASAWTTVNLNNSYYPLTNLTEQTTYEWQVAYVCGTTQGNFAGPVQFTTEQLPYCAANPTNNTTRTYISNVTTNAVGAPALVSNSTGAAGYTDYTGDPSRLATFIMGTANNTVSVSKSWAGTQYAAGVGVWIDFNRNGTFEATERVVTSTSNLTTPIVSAPFTVPLPPGAYNGPLNTRMRVIVQEAGNPSACGTFTYGEVEDYDVRLVEPIPCTTAAPQGLGAGNMSPVSATLTWMPATGAQYVVQWRPVTTPASPWTVVTPAPVDSYHILTGLMEQTTYEFQVAYICSGTQGAFSTPYQFTTPPLQWCNAGSTVTNVDDHITNVTVDPTGFPIFPTMSNNSGTSNYTNYYFDTTKRVSLVLGSTGNTISVSKGWVNAPNNVAIDAWIDFNRDGVFDVTELIMSFTPSQTTPVVATFDVPAVGYAGNLPTKMRVIARRTSPAAACGTFDYGEVEDYAVDLVEPIPCNSNPVANLQVTGITHNTATVTWTPDPGGATYIVRHKPVGAANWTAQIPVTFLTGTYTIPNLTPSTQYIVEVVALCDNVPGTPAEIPFETLCNPEPPTNFVVTNITPDSAVVTWDPVPSASYVVEYREVGSTTWTTVNVTTNSYTLTNLDPYTTYEVRVASVCSGAQNPFSTPVVFTTLPTCEMAPVGLIITNLTMTTAQIDWNAFPGASYELRWRKVGNSGWNSVTVNTNTYILTGLTEETQYEVMIANICNGGLQQFTHPYVFTTPTLVYCNMEGANSSDEFISNVTVKPAGGTEMTNDSGASGYTSYVDAIDKMIVLAQGSTGNQISITKQWTGQVYNEAVTVWIDFNRDGKFANDERILIAPANTNNPAAGTFSVPADAYVSLTNDKYLVMRVAMRRNGSPEMCSTFDNGEVEDYKVRIVKPRPNNIMDNNQVILYPNPVKNILNVTKVKDGATYKVYNSIGQLIQNGAIFSNRMDVSKLISGVYIIDITDTNGETVQKKFIKE